jgi:hypothetical protein
MCCDHLFSNSNTVYVSAMVYVCHCRSLCGFMSVMVVSYVVDIQYGLQYLC